MDPSAISLSFPMESSTPPLSSVPHKPEYPICSYCHHRAPQPIVYSRHHYQLIFCSIEHGTAWIVEKYRKLVDASKVQRIVEKLGGEPTLIRAQLELNQEVSIQREIRRLLSQNSE